MEYLRTLIYEDNRGTTKNLSEIFGAQIKQASAKLQNIENTFAQKVIFQKGSSS